MAAFPDIVQLPIQGCYPVFDAAPVDFELGLSGPPGADAAGQPGQCVVFDTQAGQEIF